MRIDTGFGVLIEIDHVNEYVTIENQMTGTRHVENGLTRNLNIKEDKHGIVR